MKQILQTPDIARLGPGDFLTAVISRVWPFIAVTFLFALLVLVVPRNMEGGAQAWLAALRPMNTMVRELALGALLLLSGVVLILRGIPPGRAVLVFTASLSQAFFTFFLYLASLFMGLLLAWPLGALFNVHMGELGAVLLGPLYGLLSAILVYLAFVLIHRLGSGGWPGDEAGRVYPLFDRAEGMLHLNRLPDLGIRAIGLGLLLLFLALFWTGLLF